MLDQFLEQLFAPDQSQGWSPMSAQSAPPNFGQRFGAMGPAASAPPNDISALLPRGTNFTPTPGMLPPAGGNQPQPPTPEMMPGGNQPPGQPPTPWMLPGGGGNPPLTQPPNPLMPPATPGQGNAPSPQVMSMMMPKPNMPGQTPDEYYSNQQAAPPPANELSGFEGGISPRTRAENNVTAPNESGDANIIHPEDMQSWMDEPNSGVTQPTGGAPQLAPDPGGTLDMSARSAMPPGGGPSGDSVGKGGGDPGSIDSRLMGGGNMPPGGGNGPAPLSLDPNGGQPGGQGSGNPIFDRLAGLFGGKLLNAAQSGHPDARSVLGRLMGTDQRGDQQMRASLAGGMAGANPNFKLGAAMKGAGGAMSGGLGQENIQNQRDVTLAQKQLAQSNFERTQGDKEQTQAALRNLYGARANYATTGRPNNAWNKPASERWKDANRLIIDKQKGLYNNINVLLPKAEREAMKADADKGMADFKAQTYKQYGFTPDGQDAGPGAMNAPPVTGARPGGPVPSTSKVVGDQEAVDRGLYDKPGMTGSGTYPDPHVLGGSTDDEQRQQFYAIKPGAIFINPKTYNDAIDEGLSPDEATRRATMSKQ